MRPVLVSSTLCSQLTLQLTYPSILCIFLSSTRPCHRNETVAANGEEIVTQSTLFLDAPVTTIKAASASVRDMHHFTEIVVVNVVLSAYPLG